MNYYFLNSHAKHYINELARLLRLDPKNTDRKLKELEKQGLLRSEFLGQQRYFSLAKNSPKLKAYRELFLHTIGIDLQLKTALQNVPGLQEAYLYGSYAKNNMDAGSDIDVLAIGNHFGLALQKAINSIQKHSGRDINVVNITQKELAKKKSNHNAFISNIFSGKIIKLL